MTISIARVPFQGRHPLVRAARDGHTSPRAPAVAGIIYEPAGVILPGGGYTPRQCWNQGTRRSYSLRVQQIRRRVGHPVCCEDANHGTQCAVSKVSVIEFPLVADLVVQVSLSTKLILGAARQGCSQGFFCAPRSAKNAARHVSEVSEVVVLHVPNITSESHKCPIASFKSY